MAQKNNTTAIKNTFLVPYGTSILGFSIILLAQPNVSEIYLWIARLILILSALMGLFSLLPRPWRFISNKGFISVVSNLAYTSWLFGFLLGWVTGTANILGPWKMIAFLIGFFWLLVILLLLTHSFTVISEKGKIMKWILPWFIPVALIATVISVFLQGEWVSGLILMIITAAAVLVALRKWKPVGILSNLMD